MKFKYAYIYHCANIGTKKVNIRTLGQENWRIIVILKTLTSEEKLASLSIFNSKEGRDTEIKLLQIKCVEKSSFILIKNVWNSENIMLKWVAEVWKNIHFKLKIKIVLVLDNAITHKIIKLRIR